MTRSKFSVPMMIAAVILVGGSVVGSTAESRSTLLINANVIDGTGTGVQKGMTVVITGTSIASINRASFRLTFSSAGLLERGSPGSTEKLGKCLPARGAGAGK